MIAKLVAALRTLLRLDVLWQIAAILAITVFAQRHFSATASLFVAVCSLASIRSALWILARVPVSHAFDLLHHLLLAATIAAGILLLAFTDYYDLVDDFTRGAFGTIRIISNEIDRRNVRIDSTGRLLGPSTAPIVESDPTEKTRIAILHLDSRLLRDAQDAGLGYLDVLAQVIEKVLPSKPRVLAISTDLAPRTDASDAESMAQRRLDDALDRGARGTTLVVPLPWVESSSPEAKLVYEWARERCKAGIHFALWEKYPSVNVLLYMPMYPSVGTTVHELWNRSSEHDLAPRAQASQSLSETICEVANREGLNAGEFYEELNHLAPSTDAVLLNSDFFLKDFETYGPYARPALPERAFAVGVDRLPQGSAVFVAYRGSSGYLAFGGRRATDAEIEAAKYYTEEHPVTAPSHETAFLFDMVFGLMIGYVFGALWRTYNKAAEALDHSASDNLSRRVRRYVFARMWLIIAVGSLPLVLYLVFRSSGFLLRNGWWLNPLPVVIGMFLDALLASRRREEVTSSSLGELIAHHPDTIVQTTFVVFVVIYALAFH